MGMSRKAELEARIAADTAELERLNAEPDLKRYAPLCAAFLNAPGVPWIGGHNTIIRALLAARNHDPDVVALVQWARDVQHDPVYTDFAVLAPFSAIKDE